MICPLCNSNHDEKEMHEHHLIPKYCFKEYKEIEYKFGKINICKKCHDILHKRIEALIFREFVNDKERCKSRIREYTSWIIGK